LENLNTVPHSGAVVTQGSTELAHALLANDLVDAMSIFTVPVVLGGGKNLFADRRSNFSLKRRSNFISSWRAVRRVP
jgi:dihydrofolate reductase